jgi:hypothetical protein
MSVFQEFIFEAVLGLQQNYQEGRDFSSTPFSHMCIGFAIINNSHQSGIFVTIGKPTLTQHNHLKSIIYIISINSWC